MTQTTAKYGIAPDPNISTPMIVQASGVFAAPANTATNPSAASRAGGTPSGPASAAPRVAPITNSGVTSPPTNPEPRVTAVNRSLRANAQVGTGAPARLTSTRPSDSPL